eukprot:4113847-Amphidinium_carterae.1
MLLYCRLPKDDGPNKVARSAQDRLCTACRRRHTSGRVIGANCCRGQVRKKRTRVKCMVYEAGSVILGPRGSASRQGDVAAAGRRVRSKNDGMHPPIVGDADPST